MPKRTLLVLAALLCVLPTHLQSPGQQGKQGTPAPSMPSQEEINELLDKASEYVATYRQTFTYAKASLAKAPTPGFYDKAMEECSQASQVIAAIKKNGATGVALLGMITILDDMTLNAARASAMTMMVAMEENKANPSDHAMQDWQDIAAAEKNVYDISELLLHATMRFISVEERALGVLLQNQKR